MNLTTELVEIKGVRLETQRIAGRADLAPIVFLHEGLGSVALWTQRGLSWPEAVCAATGRAGLVYSRRGYGQSDPVPDVRAAPGESGGQRTGRLLPDYMHREAWDVLPALLEALQISKPVLLGHSDGASIALLHASRHPVAACIAMAPHVLVEDIAVQAIAQATVPSSPEACANAWRATTPMSTWPSGNGTTSGCRRPSAALTSAKTAAASAPRCCSSRAWTTNTARCASSTKLRWRRPMRSNCGCRPAGIHRSATRPARRWRPSPAS
jgi:pimeloyl-ACP methyl ester carboxylesterase